MNWDADTAVEQLYAAHWRSLVRLGVLLLHDQAAAEDVVQDAFVALHGRWRHLRDPERALAYLRQSVVNRARSLIRHRGVVQRHVATVVAEPPPQPTGDAESRLLTTARRDEVLHALARLPRRQREVLALRYYLDLPEAEIASLLGISRGAVKSHASRAAAALRDQLDHHREDRP